MSKTFATSEITVAFVAEHAPEVAEALKKMGVTEAEGSIAERIAAASEEAVASARGNWETDSQKAVEDAVAAERERCSQILSSAFEGQSELVAQLVTDGTSVSDALSALIKGAQEAGGKAGKAPMAMVQGTEPKDPPAASDGGKETGSGFDPAEFAGIAKSVGVPTHGSN